MCSSDLFVARATKRFFEYKENQIFHSFYLFHQLCHFFDDDMAQLILAHLRILFHMAIFVQERCDVCRAVEAGARHGDVVRDEHVEVLA